MGRRWRIHVLSGAGLRVLFGGMSTHEEDAEADESKNSNSSDDTTDNGANVGAST